MFDFPIYVLRHGQTEWNVEARFQGHMDSPLTARGREHAKAQRRILSRLNLAEYLCWCSPLGRAQATAEIAAKGLLDPIELKADLMEIGMGDWEGLPHSQIKQDRPLDESDEAAFDHYDRAPGGEGLAALEQRCLKVLHYLGARGQPAVLVTHGITSRMLRTLLMGRSRVELGQVGGGQGIVYALQAGVQRKLEN